MANATKVKKPVFSIKITGTGKARRFTIHSDGALVWADINADTIKASDFKHIASQLDLTHAQLGMCIDIICSHSPMLRADELNVPISFKE